MLWDRPGARNGLSRPIYARDRSHARSFRRDTALLKDTNTMKYQFLVCTLLATSISGCTSDPYAPINQTTPIRQMDNAFEGRPINAPPPGYRDYDYGSQPYSRY